VILLDNRMTANKPLFLICGVGYCMISNQLYYGYFLC